MSSSPPPSAREAGVLSRDYVWVTIGACALVFLGAFESLAVTTIMPQVSAELDGDALYSLAFAGPLATGVIGMVIAGNWADRKGPTAPLYTSALLFVIGLLIAGTATAMPAFLLGRLVQGLGTGAIQVALYVVVARVFPARLHASIFAGFAAAWVIPSLIGPYIAGKVAELFTWHWVFLGVVGLAVAATVMVAPALRGIRGTPADTARPPWAVGRMLWALAAAVAVLVLNLIPAISAFAAWALAWDTANPLWQQGFQLGIAILAIAAAIIAVRPLLPRGTLRADRGLPSVILLRGLAAAAFFGTEVYLPFMLVREYGFEASAAGLAVTTGAIAWALASWIQGRMGDTLPHETTTVVGSILLFVAVLTSLGTAAFHLHPAVAIIGWALAGGGMGLMYPRISVMTLALSTPTNQGFNSAAMSISDSLGGALALASTALIAAALGLPGVFLFAAILAVFAIAVAPRVVAQRARH